MAKECHCPNCVWFYRCPHCDTFVCIERDLTSPAMLYCDHYLPIECDPVVERAKA